MKYQIEYYNGKLRKWIDSMPVRMRAYYARLTERMLEMGPNLEMPFTKSLGGGLFELRIKAQEGISRVFYCVIKRNTIVMLHGFIKKTQKIPSKELKIATERLKEVSKEDGQ